MTQPNSWYLYAIAESYSLLVEAISRPEGAGIAALPQGIETFRHGSLTAVASPFSGERVRPERRNLAAHHAVHRALFQARVPFLPVSFGVVAPSREALMGFLCLNAEEIATDLDRLTDKVEMGLRVVWDVPNIFDHFVFLNPALARLRDYLNEKPGGPSREDKIELGRMFDAMLGDARTEHEATVRRLLGRHAVEIAEDPPRDERMVMNLVFLIERGREKDFEAAVLQAASRFDDHYAFDYNGPWPPYHFVRATLQPPTWGRGRREGMLSC